MGTTIGGNSGVDAGLGVAIGGTGPGTGLGSTQAVTPANSFYAPDSPYANAQGYIALSNNNAFDDGVTAADGVNSRYMMRKICNTRACIRRLHAH